MDFTIIRRKTTILHILFAIIFTLLPLAGGATPQQADITKPTRERVKSTDKKTNDKNNKDKNSSDKKATNKKDDKSATGTNKKDDKSATVASKKDNKSKDTKSTVSPKKDDKSASSPKKDDKSTPAPNKDDKKAAVTQKADKPVVKKEENQQAIQDTAAKPKPTQPQRPPKKPINPDSVKFDGIDVSKHQEHINWGELRKNNRIQYVYIRATVGSDITDAKYKENVHNARKHGFKVGSYHYMTNLSSVRGQFENFRKMVDKNDQDLLPMIDVEVRNRWTKQQLRDSLILFTQLIEDHYGCTPIIYTYETFYKDNLGIAFESYPLFIAKYSNQRPNIGGAKWLMWQFCETGFFAAVKGNKGMVDLSRFNDGCSINDILYKPSNRHKPKTSVKDAVDHKEKPATINAATEKKPKETAKPSSQSGKQKADEKKKAEEKKKADKEARAKELSKKKAKEEAAKKAKEEEEAAKKAKHRADQQKREKERQEAAQKAADEKAKRKAAAQKARDEKAKQNASQKSSSSKKSTSVRGALTQSQRNDSIRAAKQSGRKINKSSADND